MAARMTIRFEVDPNTGERTIIIGYQSDPDALPMEHEEEHRALVEKLIEGGLITAAEAGKVTIEREAAPSATAETERAPDQERQAVKQGS